MRFNRAFIFVFLSVVAMSASAQNNFDLDILGQGEIMLNLSANEQTEVEQDTLHANLTFSSQGRDRVSLQDEVNRKMAEALEILAGSEVEYSTQQYRVYQLQSGRPTRGEIDNPVWRAQQGVELHSMDSAAVLDLVAQLQELGLTMSGLNYSLSPERHEEISDSLMESALARLRSRAEAAAAAMGKSSVEFVEITMNNNFGGGMFRSLSTAMAMESMDVATPVAEPGLATVNFSVSARVILLP
jgi:predicted secreted protein